MAIYPPEWTPLWGILLSSPISSSSGVPSKRTCTWCHLSHLGVIKISGEDALGFLQGQVTCDVRTLQQGQLGFGAFCTPKGRVIANFRLAPIENGFLLVVSKDLVTSLIKRLKLYILRSKVTIEDLSADWIILGLSSADVDCPVAGAFRYAQGRYITVLGTIEDPPPLILDDLEHVDEHEWTLKDIREGLPWIQLETSERFLPQMINLDTLEGIGFQKGCYTGQEIVARTHYLGQLKRRLYRLIGRSDQPTVTGGTVVDESSEEGQSVGDIVNVATNSAGEVECLTVLSIEATQKKNLRLQSNREAGWRIETVASSPVDFSKVT